VKLREIERPISAYADGLELANAVLPASGLRQLAQFLKEVGDFTTTQLNESRPRVVLPTAQLPGSDGGARVPDVVPHLKALEKVLRTGESTVANELRLLIKCLGNDSVYLSPMLGALRRALTGGNTDEAVAEFIARLNKDMGTDAFERTLAELKASSLRREHVVQVAHDVYGGIPKGTTRKAALAFIRKPHDARVNARRGIDALGGRSAA